MLHSHKSQKKTLSSSGCDQLPYSIERSCVMTDNDYFNYVRRFYWLLLSAINTFWFYLDQTNLLAQIWEPVCQALPSNTENMIWWSRTPLVNPLPWAVLSPNTSSPQNVSTNDPTAAQNSYQALGNICLALCFEPTGAGPASSLGVTGMLYGTFAAPTLAHNTIGSCIS